MERSAIHESPGSAEDITGHSDPRIPLRCIRATLAPSLRPLELRKAASKHDLRGNALLLSIFVVYGHRTMLRWKIILRKEDAELVEGLDEINEEPWWWLRPIRSQRGDYSPEYMIVHGPLEAGTGSDIDSCSSLTDEGWRRID
jgi:hypothetical protein